MLSDIFDFWNIILYVINCVAQFAKLIFTTPLLIFCSTRTHFVYRKSKVSLITHCAV